MLPSLAVTSTISSTAVSGSITTVKVSPADTLAPPRSDVPETTVADVPDEVSAPDNVVCWEREEYFLVGIQVPIGVRNELVVGSSVVVLLFLR